jgi:AraC family transcriptional regulator
MISNVFLRELESRYALVPAQFVLQLPETQLSVIRWRRLKGDAEQVFERHPVDGYTLSIVLQPMRANAWLNERPVWSGPIGANTIRLTLPGAKTRWVSDSSFDLIHLYFPRHAIDQMAAGGPDRIHDRLRASAPLYRRDDVAANLGRAMLESLRCRRPFAMTFVDAMGRALLAHTLGLYTQPAEPSLHQKLDLNSLRRVRDFVKINLHSDIRVRDLALITGMSESHFAHRFRATMGVSPHRYVTTSRLDIAQIRLQCNSDSVLRIAIDCGFKDASHFSRVFKRFFGCSPQVFRREGRSASPNPCSCEGR